MTLEQTHLALTRKLAAEELATVQGPFLPSGIPRGRFNRRPYDELSNRQRWRMRAVHCLREYGAPVLPHLRWRLGN
jgi:hypothetical protein